MAQPRVSLRRLCRLESNGPLAQCRSQLMQIQSRRWQPLARFSQHRLMHTRDDHKNSTSRAFQAPASTKLDFRKLAGQELRQEWSQYNHFSKASEAHEFAVGNQVVVHGFLGARRILHKNLLFANIRVEHGPHFQVTVKGPEACEAFKLVPLNAPVSVTGTVTELISEKDSAASAQPSGRFPNGVTKIDLDLEAVRALNVWPKEIIVSRNVQFPPKSRHLQIRFSQPLSSRLLARPKIAFQLRRSLESQGFTEVETPILFKSTPEGAREFLVPTRRKGFAYALPQSPQQYKQILMASGVRAYYQFARCFRDEDLRADRQLEFTQLDLEMAFATGQDVMQAVESLVSELPAALNAQFNIAKQGDDVFPIPKWSKPEGQKLDLSWPEMPSPFLRLTYQEAMTRFGSDKPDLRIPFEIRRVDQVLPSAFVQMITDIKNPVVEAFRFRPQPVSEEEAEASSNPISPFTTECIEAFGPEAARFGGGAPVALVFDTKKPLCGLSSLGHAGFEGLTSGAPGLEDFADLEDGDVVVFQARKDAPFQGGATALGTFRNLVYQRAVSSGRLPRDLSFKFLWVVNFPLFTPDKLSGPGQGGGAGFSATHHPFTAPLTDEDVELLATNPLKARGDHYDLVVNGIELGGGSRRIHVAKMQEYVMKEVLKMTDKGMGLFKHLLAALGAGCPPHAGFALGFDRLVAVLTHTNSLRDVIAFPKSIKGDDLMVKSPGRITNEELKTYHLSIATPKTQAAPAAGPSEVPKETPAEAPAEAPATQ
ncbi:tRNA synthetases class II-domain-containing protein [Lasiosphaeria ovina]|uniref:tRNA synthetases class II-domain-containing protein n=1 Tax=Lasiosphaeria ovina TaxID=92902 RepID=A0AAE0NLN5_9PEZI|nr:tRNA synthetases class II-domain-containing protein [Lasiosphaeria ovina]